MVFLELTLRTWWCPVGVRRFAHLTDTRIEKILKPKKNFVAFSTKWWGGWARLSKAEIWNVENRGFVTKTKRICFQVLMTCFVGMFLLSKYYSHKLSAVRLKRVYDIAPPRVRQYLDAEVSHVLEKISPADLVLELGCGYGRILPKLAENARWVAGIDVSAPSLEFARDFLRGISNISLSRMDAVSLGYRDQTFDRVVCIQNGISAFHVDQRALISESIRVTRLRGVILFSSYSNKFWRDRMKWFELQSQAGLLGEIDYEKTKEGIIVCKDGFTATTVGPQDFSRLTHDLIGDVQITEVDESSLFCEIVPNERAR